ncbi:hypothetical protein MAMC_00530 [Methylacidimicrobium cyclopophantes]|uniref:Uncharacterized protein n=1 Tax=Methylacidimicrobium cyclopophantes TaxID=1041766 RepID=A0A5E6MAN7_9BACT|nr:hypothetical protein [Methylacidimicrobium cyclopophantes]VVM05388.1 hypothetical protein MAMC_00530 [Methylacidimicrobium cyclopophantes]
MRIVPVVSLGFFFAAGLLPAQPTSENGPEAPAPHRASTPHRIERKPAAPTLPEKPGKPPEARPPKAQGIIPEGIRKGPNMINPLAPKEYGYGRRFLSRSAYTPHIPYSAGQTEVMTPGGGLELFTWEW